MELTRIATIAFISLLAAMSPGPDFAMVTKNSLSGSFRSGALTALGVGCALMVHISYCLFGVAIIIYESPLLFLIIKYLGAAYLLYLGILLLKEKRTSPEGSPKEGRVKGRHHPFVSGFLCNLLNPKATLFVLSLFTQFIHPDMTLPAKISLGSVIAIVTLVWFLLLSYLITHRFLQKHFAKFQWIITKTMGGILCLLAVSLIFFS